MITIKPGRYFIGVWYAERPGGNWMAAVYRDEGETEWTLIYRFRYFRDQKAFDSDDERSWWESRGPDTEEGMKDAVDRLVEEAIRPEYPKTDFIPMRSSNAEENMTRLRAAPWAHARTEDEVSPEERARWDKALERDQKRREKLQKRRNEAKN